MRQLDAIGASRATGSPPLGLLDVGCGEGSLLGALAAHLVAAGTAVEAWGVDLSQPAVELAARRFPALGWAIANADRFLPFAGADVALLLSARAAPGELHRVLAPGGRLLLAAPAADDLVELRAAVLGEGVQKDRMERLLAELAPHFDLDERRAVRHRATLEPAALADALAATYRGARRSQQERREALVAMPVTLSFDVARLRRRD